MDTAQFLARVVAPGNYAAIAFKGQQHGMTQRFYPYDKLASAAGFAQWCAGQGLDSWHAVASYKLASPHAKGHYQGQRTQDNAQALRCFWLDADIKRAGDNKAPDKAYADMTELVVWVRDFAKATGLPVPNLWVNSGYGMHLYWVLEDALPASDWRGYAEAFKAAMLANGAKGDISTTADSARILRPPGTLNFKVSGSPVPVTVLDKLSRGDYPNDLIFQALQPYVGQVSAKISNGGSLAGSPPSVFALRQQTTSSATAAAQTVPDRREHLFSEIANRCLQVKTSLANGGAGDSYPLWYLGLLSLAGFCTDGTFFAHEVSKGDPRYDPAAVDAALQQAKHEHQTKGTGAPTCAHFDGARPGICQTCPHFGKVNSPYSLGVEDGQGDFPDLYRRHEDRIERAVKDKDGNVGWVTVVSGAVYAPVLDRVGEDRKLTFIYERARAKSAVAVMQSAVPVDAAQAMRFFGPQGVTLYKHNAEEFGRFVVSWIEKLRDMRAERENPIPPFGWVVKKDGTYNGFAVGGTYYRPDGSEEPAPGGDPKILGWYKPKGKLDDWKAACAFVVNGRPDLQVLVAAAFAAPLVEFTGHYGFIMSAWSRDSAVGKSSALQIGTTVWADPKAMFHLKDTANSIVYRIGHTRVTPAYWDEIQLDKDEEDKFVDTLFMLGQGKEKARLNSDSTLKESGDWKTILVTTGNRPLMDYVVKRRNDTDAGAVRLFEFLLEHPQLPLNTVAAQTIASAGTNAGNAGRVYAAWLAANATTARSLVTKIQQKLEQSLGAMQSERFFVAGMACITVGAFVAHSLGLVKFDMAGMQEFLKRAFYKLRDDRNTNLPVHAGYFDIERVFADFVADNAADRLVTKHFHRPGPPQKLDVVWAPRKLQGRLAIHIGQFEQRMRIDRIVWRNWCYSRGFSPSDITLQLELRWGAKHIRTVLGAGTDYATGKVDVIEIPLTSPELAEYNYSYDSQGKK